MNMIIEADPVPLRVDEHGAIRVGGTRITLERIIEEHESGSTPQEIVQAYDVLRLADVYAAIAYYLRHQEEVKAYLRRREEEANRLQQMIEANQKPGPTGPELRKRWAERNQTNAPPRQ